MQRRWRRWWRAVAGAVIAAWMLSAAGVVLWGARDEATPSDAIVVMGAAQYAGRPSPVLRARLDHAVALWNAGLGARVILTGGMGAGDTTSEAEVGRRYVVRRGVPDSIILMENEGRTTAASLEAVASIMRTNGLSRAILVSDPFHMLRLHILAYRFGMKCVTSPTRTSPISASPSEVLGYVLSESIKAPITLLLTVLHA